MNAFTPGSGPEVTVHRGMAEPTAAPPTDRQLCEHWPIGTARPCYAIAEWAVVTPWWAALRHACEAHREALDQEVKVTHRVVRVEEWRASSRGFRPGLGGS